MSRRMRLVPLVALAMTLASCAADVGPGTPICPDERRDQVSAVTILQLQAVPDAMAAPCIAELKVGWEYGGHLSESGRSTFWLDSDRMGDRFLEAVLTPSCDAAGAVPAESPVRDVERRIRVLEQPGTIQIAVIPVAPRHGAYASEVLAQLDGRRLEGRGVTAFVPVSNAAPAMQIERALENGQVAVIIDDREEASRTIEMRRLGQEPEVGISIEDAIDELEDDLDEPAYRASWYHLFSGGCITYEIDAGGAGAETVAAEIDDVLGFYPLSELRRALEEIGRDV